MAEITDESGQLRPEQRAAIEALASGATKEQAATVAGRTRRTLDRWIAGDPAFRAALQATTDEAVKDAARRLAALLEDAVTAMHDVVARVSSKDADRLRAAEMILANAVKMREFAELADQVAELREAVNELKARG